MDESTLGGVVPLMGELDSLGIRKRGILGVFELGKALKRGIERGEPAEVEDLF